ncbi:MAG TPA: GntG family PLP-dependent aldolase [Rudaea sp.]|jgi:threonine aldolase|nr:GntG family PLP-dependent aldolase [Rudaea sp.]
MIELFSDTKTKPSEAMRRVMANAEVGDERAGEDPSVNALINRCIALLGKQAAVYLPSGTMCNEIALAVHCKPGDEVICDATSHIIGFEGGGPAALAGVMLNPVAGVRGIYSADQLREKIRPDRPYAPRQRLVEVEQTANLGGGAIWPLSILHEVSDVAHAAGLLTHMDGARLLNASVASGVSAAEYAHGFDSVWIDFSKGLGAPGGAVLAGTGAFVDEANRWKLRIGGAMRQSGIIAAACLYALDNNVARLADDHANAKRLADGIAHIDGLRIDAHSVETNLVYFDVTDSRFDAEKICEALFKRGVRMSQMGTHAVRAVTHLDVDANGIDVALEHLREVLKA